MREKISITRLLPLGLQHVFAMFGATIFVPLVTGLDPSVALFTSGLGTILFHIITKGKVPAYLGSSFAFIAPITLVTYNYGVNAAIGACAVAGLMYLIVGFLIKKLGSEVIQSLVPPVVIGPVIMVIGLGLAGVANDYASEHYLTALVTLAIVIVVSIFAKGFFKLIPILSGIVGGYIFVLIGQSVGFAPELISYATVASTSWQPALPNFIFPVFNINAILIIAPIALVTMIEHLGDMMAISRTVGIDYIEDPGLHRTLIGDGLATTMAGFLGGPPNTTYGENIGVLALTKVTNPIVVEAAAVIVLLLSVFPKVGEVINTIPLAVMGGVMIMVFGMIASVGMRTLIEKNVDLMDTRNLIIVSVTLVVGLSGISFFDIEGMGLAAIVGILLNKVLPETKEETN